MRQSAYTTRFHKDLKKAIKRGKDLDKLKAVSHTLVAGEPAPLIPAYSCSGRNDDHGRVETVDSNSVKNG